MSLDSHNSELHEDSLSSEPQQGSQRSRMLQILGAGALLFTVGCQNPGTEDSADEDTTDKKSPKHETSPTTTASTEKSATEGCPVKGNINSKGRKIAHEKEGCPDWSKTKINRDGERCFKTMEEAVDAGWKKANNCK